MRSHDTVYSNGLMIYHAQQYQGLVVYSTRRDAVIQSLSETNLNFRDDAPSLSSRAARRRDSKYTQPSQSDYARQNWLQVKVARAP